MRHQLPAYSPITWAALAAGTRAVITGDRHGRLAARLVERMRARYGARDVLLTDSGTSALRLAIEVASDEDGPVALPGYACYDLASAAEGAGARVALYDLDPKTLSPDMNSLRRVVSGGVNAVVVAHLYGYPVDIPAVQRVAGEALVIEDAAQGVGARLHGRALGAIGSVAILSFGRGKGMTGGGGGALLAHDERGERILVRARERLAAVAGPRGAAGLAALVGQHVLGRPSIYGIPAALPFLHLGETVYRPPTPPGRMGVAAHAVLARIIDTVDAESRVRRMNAATLLRAARDSRRVDVVEPISGGEAGYLRLPVLVEGRLRSDMIRALRRLGAAAGYPTTLLALESLAPHVVGTEDLRGSRELAERLVTLPTHSLLAGRDVAEIERWLLRG